MKFWPPSALDPENETDQAEMLEAYTQWLNGEKLSDKQKKYLRVFQGSGDLEPLKELVDYVHYNFEEHEESEVFEPPANVKQRVEQKLMKCNSEVFDFQILEILFQTCLSSRRTPSLFNASVNIFRNKVLLSTFETLP